MNCSHSQLKPGGDRFQVTSTDEAQRLDLFLASSSEFISRGLARRLIEIGGVHVDGRRMRQCGAAVTADQKVEVYVDGLSLQPFALEERHLLFHDKYLVAINKPAGVVTQPTPARYPGSYYDALQPYLT